MFPYCNSDNEYIISDLYNMCCCDLVLLNIVGDVICLVCDIIKGLYIADHGIGCPSVC